MNNTIDINSLTINEIELVEDVCEASIEDVLGGKVRTSRTMKAFALVALRRDNPNATLQDAGSVSVSGLDEMLSGADVVPFDTPRDVSTASKPSPTSRRPRASQSKT